MEIQTYGDNCIEDSIKTDIEKRLCELAKSYVPEWRFQTGKPDIGSVIAMLYAGLMAENYALYQEVPKRLHTDFINLTDISQKGAHPAQSTVVIEPAADAGPGMYLSEGTKLLGTDREGQSLIFETVYPVYLTSAALIAAFCTSAAEGTALRLFGDFPHLSYADEENGDGKDSGWKEGLLLYHPWIFDGRECEIDLYLPGGEEVLDGILDGAYTLSRYQEDGFAAVSSFRRKSAQILTVRWQGGCKKVSVGKERYSLLLLENRKPAGHIMSADDIGFSSCGKARKPDIVWNGSRELEADSFEPFGDALSLYEELYIGHSEYFCRPGAKVRISFHLRFAERLVSLPGYREDGELKIIKRKPRSLPEAAPADVRAQEVTLEYFNGAGFRKIKADSPAERLFDGSGAGERVIEFTCPEDWEEVRAGGVLCRCLKLCLVKADDCYLMPAVHHVPVVEGLKISYCFEGHFERPAAVAAVRGAYREELTQRLYDGRPVPLFVPSPYKDNSLYLGFNRRMEAGPVGVWLRMKEEAQTGGSISFSYSSEGGFRRLEVTDHTEGLSHTGTLVFFPPADMKRLSLEGIEAFWIRITEEPDGIPAAGRLPLLEEIRVNAVDVENLDTGEEEEFYLDKAEPDMVFPLRADDIYDAQVWVNEAGSLSAAERERLRKEAPGRIREEYDLEGRIARFFVKWDEVQSFAGSGSSGRYYILDRAQRRILFGDGVHVRIPENTQDVAFVARLRRCRGRLGNLPEGTITESMGDLYFVQSLKNPLPAYGGEDMESAAAARGRGTALLSGGGRTVSLQDFERECLYFSDSVGKVRAVAGMRKDGRGDDSCVSLVVLMKDYKKGSGSFLKLRDGLIRYFCTAGEPYISAGMLFVEEPLFIEYSVTVWAETDEDGLTVQKRILSELEACLDPVRSAGAGIGRLPDEGQIRLKLQMEVRGAEIRRMMVAVRYRDDGGYHEADPGALAQNPFTAPASGSHTIYVKQTGKSGKAVN